ncbi:MAG: FIST C-terminal domain-containing protein [Polyangiaceae bacterium]|nr:FIST C-terminal domain-containing protein [Polyangiaceae bacterium]
MPTRVATAAANGSTSNAAHAVVSSLREGLAGEAPSLVTVFASTKQPLSELMPLMAAAFPGAVILGSSTAGEFTEKGDTKDGVSVAAVSGQFRVFAGMGTGLKEAPEKAVEQALDGIPQKVFGYPYRTAILLLDPLAGNGEETTLLAAAMLEEDVCLAGGAAGDDLKMLQTWVGLGDRAESNAVVIALVFSKSPLGVGVCHGHTPMSQPLRVTKADGSLVQEIDGKPAWDVWRDVARESARARGMDVDALGPNDAGGFLLLYEAGLAAGSEHKIRAPLAPTAEGAIQFACAIPEGTVFRMTESSPKEQINSAREAAKRAHQRLGAKAAGAIVFDCICRNLILSHEFDSAVKAMSDELGGVPLSGFETYGEIALDVGDLSGFHNTTTVVLAFPES